MLNLKLFTSLQGQNTASLLLKPSSPGYVQFFLMSTSVNYNIIVSGECEGELPGVTPLSFDLVLSSITPLLDKNFNFRITYQNNVLRFIEGGEKFFIEPLCVEHISDFAMGVAQKYLDITKLLGEVQTAEEKIADAEDELRHVQANYHRVRAMDLSGGPPADPWGSVEDLDNTEVEQRYKPKIDELNSRLGTLRKTAGQVREVDFSSMRRLANIAAKYNTTISMCDDFAVVELRNCYALQKCDCGSRAIAGKLLQRLLQENTGKFYEVDGEIFFHSTAGTGKAKSDTTVFLQPYMANTIINGTIVTKGAVQEKYTLNIKGMFAVANTVLSKFDHMVFEMGSSQLILSNDRGEHLVYKFEMEDANTIELAKTMRGEAAGAITMASVEIPREVQRIISMLRDNFVIYVKERKIVLQSGNMYVVFAR